MRYSPIITGKQENNVQFHDYIRGNRDGSWSRVMINSTLTYSNFACWKYK